MRGASAAEHPWLKSYPEGVDWDARFKPTLLGGLLDQAVAAYGAAPLHLFHGQAAELSPRSARCPTAPPRACGSSASAKASRSGCLLPNTPAFVIFYYGVLKAGGTVVNFNPLYSLEEIEFQIRDSGAKIMVTLDLALTFDKIEALLKRGALEKAVVASFTSLLPALKSVGFKLTQRAEARRGRRVRRRRQDRARARPARQ